MPDPSPAEITAARLAAARVRRRRCEAILASPAIQSDARAGDQDARRELEAASEQLRVAQELIDQLESST